jgi:REP element-mobilizing transposase RayT
MTERRVRKAIRLRHFAYSQPGAYFVTTCVQHRACLFGEVVDGVMRMNDAGRVVAEWWLKLNSKFPSVQSDTYAVMPNHFHGIVTIVGADPRVRPGPGAHAGAPLPTIMQWFKTMTTNAYIRGVKEHDWRAFSGKLWQRNYYEHVIRTERELTLIREYIADNPLQWHLDRENPAATAGRVSTDLKEIFGDALP